MIRTDGKPTIAHYSTRVPSTREDLIELVANHPSDEVLAELLVRHDITEVDVFLAQLEPLLDA